MRRRAGDGVAGDGVVGLQRVVADAGVAVDHAGGRDRGRETMILLLLPLIPVCAGLLCLATESRSAWERLNLGAFIVTALMAFAVTVKVMGQGTVSAFDGFLRVDALSALVLDLTSAVALVCAIYSVGYFRREELDGRITR